MREVSRHEEKYIVSTAAALMLRSRFRAALRQDRHAGPDGSYFIRSVYFDDRDYSAYHEKLSGTKERTKYRIRAYNMEFDRLLLEKKEKDGDLSGKLSAFLNREEAEALLYNGDLDWCAGQPLTSEFAHLLRCGYQPAVLVDYDRFAYTYPVENVRITLDTDVRTCPYTVDPFAWGLPMVPVLEEGECILEVKYNRFLPPQLGWVLEGFPKQRMAVSKYVRCLSLLE